MEDKTSERHQSDIQTYKSNNTLTTQFKKKKKGQTDEQ